jgi:hypothetical protein
VNFFSFCTGRSSEHFFLFVQGDYVKKWYTSVYTNQINRHYLEVTYSAILLLDTIDHAQYSILIKTLVSHTHHCLILSPDWQTYNQHLLIIIMANVQGI